MNRPIFDMNFSVFSPAPVISKQGVTSVALYLVNPVILSKNVISSKNNKIRENPENPRIKKLPFYAKRTQFFLLHRYCKCSYDKKIWQNFNFNDRKKRTQTNPNLYRLGNLGNLCVPCD